MNTKKDIGKIISERLEEASFVADEKQWTAIVQRLDEKKRKRRFLFALLLLLTGTLGFLLFSPFSDRQDETKIGNEETVNTQNTPTENIQENNTDHATTTLNKVNPSEKRNVLGLDSINKNVPNIQGDTPQTESSTETNEGNSIIAETPLEKKGNQQNNLVTSSALKNKNTTKVVDKTNASKPIPKKNTSFDTGATQKTSYYYYNSADNTTLETENKKVIDSILSNPKTGVTKDDSNNGNNSNGIDDLQLQKDTDAADQAQYTLDSKTGESDYNSEKTEVQDSLKTKGVKFKEDDKEAISDSLSIQEEEETKSRWGIRAIGAPTYYSVPHNGSIFGRSVEVTSSEGQFTFNYGAEVNFEFNKKMSISLGALRTKLTNTSNAIHSFNVVTDTLTTIESVAVRLKQDIEYIEVPLTLDYTFLGKEKLGVKALGGFSTYFLTNNDITIEDIGETPTPFNPTENLSRINLSLNIGIGFYGALADNLYFEFRPLYKYHINTYQTSSRNTSYSFGLNFGLRYVFDKKKKEIPKG